jgi:iron-sulfur cluster assembly protein
LSVLKFLSNINDKIEAEIQPVTRVCSQGISHRVFTGVSMTQAISEKQGILMTDAAIRQVLSLREKQGKDLCLRVGVRQGGCSGMSYVMDFTDISMVGEHDDVFDYEGFKVVCDRKSLLYLYGLVLDFSDAMIGGGFQFTNPNATQTCGCGNSFSA